MNRFNDTDFSDFKGLPKIRFKGGESQSTSKNIPAQTSTEAGLLSNSANYANSTMGSANGMLSNINNLTNQGSTVADQTSTGYTNLLNGNLPSTYSQARQQALNADLTGTVGNAVNNLASRGIINGSSQNSVFDGITKNASNTLANNYSSDLNNYSNLLTSNLNNYKNELSNSVSNANSLAGNTSNLYNTMYNGRMNSAGTTTTKSGGKGAGESALGTAAGIGLGNSSFGSKW